MRRGCRNGTAALSVLQIGRDNERKNVTVRVLNSYERIRTKTRSSMEKIEFRPAEGGETAWFYVVEETRINGVSYLLVTETEEEEAEAYILKDISKDGDEEAVYEFVDNDEELEAVSKIFTELLEDVDIEL